MFHLREYQPEKDAEAAIRIFEEAGWIEKARGEKKNAPLKDFFGASTAFVAELRGNAECFAATAPGYYRYLETDLDFCGVMAVLTSRIARKQNVATELTGLSLARAAEKGAAIAGLGIFEQGFYNKLGFGNGPYEHHVSFNPANLKVSSTTRIPFRLGADDYKTIHASRLSRLRKHGAVSFIPPEITHLELLAEKNGFGLGFFDEETEELTAHIWMKAEREHGPYRVFWISYRTYGQFLELLSLLKNLSDQVFSIVMREPPGIQMQDLISKPFKYEEITKGTKYENDIHTAAYYQLRILDIDRCVTATTLQCEPISFNLTLTDPLERVLVGQTAWRGVAGDYTVRFAEKSNIHRGHESGLPLLKASVGAFTRMWLGIRPAGTLAVTDNLKAPLELLDSLDSVLHLPSPKADWDF